MRWRENCIKKLLLLMVMVFLLMISSSVLAKEITGQAYIEGGNITLAREKAKKDAMRNFVEQEIGVRVRSQSEMANFLLIKDSVVTNSEGYILLKRIIREAATEDIYTIVLDLEHGAKPFELAPEDIAGQLANLSENSSRNGLDIAVIDDSKTDTYAYNMFLANRLEKAGFRMNQNDAALSYLQQNFNLDPLSLNAGVRQAALPERGDSMALVRGRISTARAPELVGKNKYRAVAEISCQIISYENNSTDAVALYADGLANTPEEAVRYAKERVLGEAVKELTEAASRTIQRENKGSSGMAMTIKTVLIFPDIVDRVQEPDLLAEIIEQCGCRIIRKNLLANGSFQVFVAYDPVGLENSSQLAALVRDRLKATYPNALNPMETSGIGSVKYIIKLRG